MNDINLMNNANKSAIQGLIGYLVFCINLNTWQLKKEPKVLIGHIKSVKFVFNG